MSVRPLPVCTDSLEKRIHAERYCSDDHRHFPTSYLVSARHSGVTPDVVRQKDRGTGGEQVRSTCEERTEQGREKDARDREDEVPETEGHPPAKRRVGTLGTERRRRHDTPVRGANEAPADDREYDLLHVCLNNHRCFLRVGLGAHLMNHHETSALHHDPQIG